jgi:hypothetical protein
MSFDLSGKKISKTFQHLLQIRGDDTKLYNLEGNEIGDLTISGSLTAHQYVVSSSVTNVEILTNSGSTVFGDTIDDTHQLTGSFTVTSSNLSIDSVGSVSGSLTSTGSFGNIVNIGNIVGSSTSTGSFGMLKISEEPIRYVQGRNSLYVGTLGTGATTDGYTLVMRQAVVVLVIINMQLVGLREHLVHQTNNLCLDMKQGKVLVDGI